MNHDLLFRYLDQSCSQEERRRVEAWLAEDPENRKSLESIGEYLDYEATEEDAITATQDWRLMEQRLSNPGTPVKRLVTPKTFRRLAVAASLLILVVSGLVFVLTQGHSNFRNPELVTRSITLPDGTQVDLGPGAKLAYRLDKKDRKRLVTLKGEAFFDVRQDADYPFIIHIGKASIEVTGTQFVVNASKKDDEVEVSVKTGQVLFYNSLVMSKNAFRVDLGPGEKGIYSPNRNRMEKSRDPNFLSIP